MNGVNYTDTNLYIESLGKAIRTIRIERGMSQKDLVQLARVSQSTISYLEKGMKNPTIATLIDICDGLSINIVDLLLLVNVIQEKEKQKNV